MVSVGLTLSWRSTICCRFRPTGCLPELAVVSQAELLMRKVGVVTLCALG